jgi:ferredoxin
MIKARYNGILFIVTWVRRLRRIVKEEIKRHALNAPGRYYVNCEACIVHECCIEIAPNNFRLGEDLSAYVFKQPGTVDEEAQCREALETCPTAAIHDDGTT